MTKQSKAQTPICPACGSKVCYYRQKTKDFICRRCGHIGKRDKFVKGGGDEEDR